MKENLEFEVKVNVENRTGRILAVYFRVRKGKAAKTREFANGAAFADYNVRGELLGIELLGPCQVKVLDKIAPREPKVRNFVKSTIPRKLVLA